MGLIETLTGVRVFFLVAALSMGIAGLFLPIIQVGHDCNYFVTELKCMGVTTPVADYSCDLARERFRATLALVIIADISLVFVIVFAILAVVMKKPAINGAGSCFMCIASIFMLTSWAMNVAFFRGTAVYCNGTAPKDIPNASYGSGLILFITSWCLMCVGNCCAVGAARTGEDVDEESLVQ